MYQDRRTVFYGTLPDKIRLGCLWNRSQMPLICGTSLHFRVFYVVYCQIKLIIMLLYFATGLRASVGQYSQYRRPETHKTAVHDRSVSQPRNRCFGDVKLTVSHFRVRINERLLINTPDTFQVLHRTVLRTQYPDELFDFAQPRYHCFTLQCCDLLSVSSIPSRATFA